MDAFEILRVTFFRILTIDDESQLVFQDTVPAICGVPVKPISVKEYAGCGEHSCISFLFGVRNDLQRYKQVLVNPRVLTDAMRASSQPELLFHKLRTRVESAMFGVIPPSPVVYDGHGVDFERSTIRVQGPESGRDAAGLRRLLLLLLLLGGGVRAQTACKPGVSCKRVTEKQCELQRKQALMQAGTTRSAERTTEGNGCFEMDVLVGHCTTTKERL